tara:strand:+ start:228 stop:374 length:147 start_codon:yes stop_codon:yes gene_type:complete
VHTKGRGEERSLKLTGTWTVGAVVQGEHAEVGKGLALDDVALAAIVLA